MPVSVGFHSPRSVILAAGGRPLLRPPVGFDAVVVVGAVSVGVTVDIGAVEELLWLRVVVAEAPSAGATVAAVALAMPIPRVVA
jgi:hypothetical protein